MQEDTRQRFVKGITVIIICFALWFLLLPIQAEYACTGTSFQRVLIQQNDSKQLQANVQEKLALYEQKYNEHLFQQQQINQPVPVPASSHFEKRGGYLGSLTLPTIGLHHTLIGTPNEKTNQSRIQWAAPSSFPSVEGSNRVVLEVKKGWASQSLLQKMRQLKTGDLFYLETHETIFCYKMQTIQPLSEMPRTKEGDFPIRANQRDCLIVYQTPLRQAMVLTAVQVPVPTMKRMVTRRTFLTYEQLIGFLIFVNGLVFGLLIRQYHRLVPGFLRESPRVKNTSVRSLYTLLQITRGYYLIVWLMVVLFFFFLVYVYFLF